MAAIPGWKTSDAGIVTNRSPSAETLAIIIEKYLEESKRVPGWLRQEGAETMAHVVADLPDDCVIVEIGAFLGSTSILIAGIRKSIGSGELHCVDPFDGSGDSFSVPVYRELMEHQGLPSQRECFEKNIRTANVQDWIEVHKGTAAAIARDWSRQIDLLFLDGDHSRDGAQLAYDSWEPFIKWGGFIGIHNSADRKYAENHDGSRVLAVKELRAPKFSEVRLVRATHFARKQR